MTANSVTDRFRSRRTQRRRRLLKSVAAAAVVVLVVGFVAWAVGFSSWFAVSHVQVSGEQTLRVTRIERVAHVQVGEPLVRVDLDAIRRRVQAIPAVNQVRVHRSWPHTITIAITERRPVAIERQAGHWHAVDVSGVVFRTFAHRSAGLPVLSGGLRDPEVVAAMARVVGALPGDLLKRVDTVDAASSDSITLHLAGGKDLVWGSADDSGRKAAVAVALMKTAARVYDVSVPEEPTTTQ